MPVLAPNRYLDRLAPTQTGLEAYQKGGVTGLIKSALSAPGTEMFPTPMAAASHALPVVGRASAVAEDAIRVSMEAVQDAKTGEPIFTHLYRWFRGGEVPGTGQFASASPNQLYSLGSKGVQQLVKFEAKNPLVVEGGHFDALAHFTETGNKAEKALAEAARRAGGEGTNFTMMDRALRKLATGRGHDAIIYKNPMSPGMAEVVKLR